jgi:ribulose kinase
LLQENFKRIGTCVRPIGAPVGNGGAAILGAVAAKAFPSILDAMGAMSGIGQVIDPGRDAVARYHHAKYSVFRKLYEDQMSYRRLMAGTAAA